MFRSLCFLAMLLLPTSSLLSAGAGAFSLVYSIPAKPLLSMLKSGGFSPKPPQLKVHVFPHGFINAPAKISVRAVMEPNELNRFLKFFVVSGDYDANSVRELHGEKVVEVAFRDLPVGEYVVEVVLFRADRSEVRGRGEQLVVLP